MKKVVIYLTAGLMVLGAQSLLAQSTSTNTPPAHGSATGAQRKEHMVALLKALDLNKEDLKGLSREERQEKIHSTAEKVSADLKAKKSAGTLTEEQEKRLAIVDKYLAHSHKKKADSN